MNEIILKIDGINLPRGANQLIVYESIDTTKTNEYGYEVTVDGGIVTRFDGNNNVVPADGFVLSGHGSAVELLKKCSVFGAAVEFSRGDGTIIIKLDDEVMKANYSKRLDLIKKRFDLAMEYYSAGGGGGFDVDGCMEIISRIDGAINNRDFKDIEKLLETATYLTAISVADEIRAVWHRPLEKSPAEVDATVKRFSEYSINMILVEAIYEGYSCCRKCTYMPLRGDLADCDFDLIEEFIAAGKKYNVKIHAWIEDFFVGVKDSGLGAFGDCPVVSDHPEWAARLKNGSYYTVCEPSFIFLNAANPEVHEFLHSMYREMLENYDFDGIQLDYIRYPLTTSIDNAVGFDDYSVEAFKKLTDIDIRSLTTIDCDEWRKYNEWKCENVTRFVKLMRDMVDSLNKNGRSIIMSTAVFGNPDEAVRLKSQNWQYWCSMNWIDMIFPMAYLICASDVEKEVRFMVEKYKNTPNIAGISPMYSGLPPINDTLQVEACRNAGARGVAFFETCFYKPDRAKNLLTGVFRQKTK